MEPMTSEEYQRFMLHSTRTGKLATVREDGRPHVVPIWFDMDGETIVFMVGDSSIKAQNFLHRPHVSLCVDDQEPPYAFVMIEGTVSTSTDMGEMLHWATRIGGRYMGADRAEEFGRRNAVEGELLVRLTPTKIIARKDVAG
jgi:PPOX class probable F420-dependent enzyme